MSEFPSSRDLATHARLFPDVLGRGLLLLPLLFALAGLCLALAPPANHDVAAIAQFAERWIDGERLYVDLVDVNPPLIFVLHAIPAWLARAVGGNGLFAVGLSVTALLCWSLLLCAWVAPAAEPAGRLLLGLLLPVLLMTLPGNDFGQREHLMVAGGLPYLLLAARRLQGETKVPGRLAVTVTAGILFALKPHFLAIPLLVELALLRERGRAGLRDPLPWLMGGLWALYGLAILLLFPDYLSLIGVLLSTYDAHGGDSTWSVLWGPILAPVALAALCLVPLGLLRGGPLARVASLATVGAMASALIQAKGWTYHAYPVKAVVILQAAWLGLEAARRIGPVARETGRAIGFAAALGTTVLALSSDERPWHRMANAAPDESLVRETLRREAAGGWALVLSPHIAPIHPELNDAGVRQAMRFMSSWVLAVAYQGCPETGPVYHPVAEMGPAERLFLDSLAEDLERHRPALLLVQDSDSLPACDGPFDQLAWLAQSPRAARELELYRPAGRVASFRILRRVSP